MTPVSRDDPSFTAPKGTRDLFPPESLEWQALMRTAMDLFAGAGYSPVETPLFEHTEVFERGVGETTEVVGKQMYTFLDLGKRSLTLRPEGTAPVVRAVVEHRLERGSLPVRPLKLAYAGPMFRQERPQKGRYREFFQVGVEAIGSSDARVDAEVIELAVRYYKAVGLAPDLLLNSIGHVADDCRLAYIEELKRFLVANRDRLAPSDRDRVESNALRTFDSKEERTIEVMREAPLISDHLCAECKAHFEIVQELLNDIGVRYELAPRLVRGLDYYTRTTFEFVSGGLGAQNAIGGGGRYDGLSQALGGPELPSIGFALGIDRIMVARADAGADAFWKPAIDVYVVAIGEGAERAALRIATELRAAGVGTDLDLAGKGIKGQMKDASRSGARWAAILGEQELASGEVTLKDLGSGEQERVSIDELHRKVGSAS